MSNTSVLIINRWNDRLCNYEKLIDHEKYEVFYLTNKVGEKNANKSISKGILVLDDLNIASLDANSDSFFKKIAKIDCIIALSEIDQELAAYLRSQYHVPGLKKNDILKFRDKVIMKQVAQESGITVPVFSGLNDINKIYSFATQYDYPIILKPKDGVSSEGVIKIHDDNELDYSLQQINMDGYECEKFIDGTVYHVDGIVFNSKIIFIKISQYLNTCLEYTKGTPLGSVMIDDKLLITKIEEFTQKVIAAFQLDNNSFHLELIIDPSNTIYFLEIGARVGGAQVPYLYEKIFNINLFQLWIDIQLGRNISEPIYDELDRQQLGGWLLIPEPRLIPSEVIKVKKMKDEISEIIDEKLPTIGHIFYGNGEYRDISAAYLLKGTSTKQIEKAIHRIINDFYIQLNHVKRGKCHDINHVESKTTSSVNYSR